jgi:glycosyltransferase involved in cell wall biosynthesis
MLLKDETFAKKIGQIAREKSLYYDWNNIAKLIVEVYKSCLGIG